MRGNSGRGKFPKPYFSGTVSVACNVLFHRVGKMLAGRFFMHDVHCPV